MGLTPGRAPCYRDCATKRIISLSVTCPTTHRHSSLQIAYVCFRASPDVCRTCRARRPEEPPLRHSRDTQCMPCCGKAGRPSRLSAPPTHAIRTAPGASRQPVWKVISFVRSPAHIHRCHVANTKGCGEQMVTYHNKRSRSQHAPRDLLFQHKAGKHHWMG